MTPDLILYTLPVFTSISRSYLSVFTDFYRFLGNYYPFCGKLESCRDPDPSVDLGRTPPPPPCGCAGYLLPCLGVIEPPHGLL